MGDSWLDFNWSLAKSKVNEAEARLLGSGRKPDRSDPPSSHMSSAELKKTPEFSSRMSGVFTLTDSPIYKADSSLDISELSLNQPTTPDFSSIQNQLDLPWSPLTSPNSGTVHAGPDLFERAGLKIPQNLEKSLQEADTMPGPAARPLSCLYSSPAPAPALALVPAPLASVSTPPRASSGSSMLFSLSPSFSSAAPVFTFTNLASAACSSSSSSSVPTVASPVSRLGSLACSKYDLDNHQDDNCDIKAEKCPTAVHASALSSSSQLAAHAPAHAPALPRSSSLHLTSSLHKHSSATTSSAVSSSSSCPSVNRATSLHSSSSCSSLHTPSKPSSRVASAARGTPRRERATSVSSLRTPPKRASASLPPARRNRTQPSPAKSAASGHSQHKTPLQLPNRVPAKRTLISSGHSSVLSSHSSASAPTPKPASAEESKALDSAQQAAVPDSSVHADITPSRPRTASDSSASSHAHAPPSIVPQPSLARFESMCSRFRGLSPSKNSHLPVLRRGASLRSKENAPGSVANVGISISPSDGESGACLSLLRKGFSAPARPASAPLPKSSSAIKRFTFDEVTTKQ